MSLGRSRAALPELEPDEGEIVESRELGAIQVGRRVGRGGMGRVHEAWRPNLPDATFAVKFLEPALLQNVEALERFESEARRLSELRHRNIVRILGYGRTKWGPCILMELLKGRPLSKLVDSQANRVLDRGLACSVVVEVLEGLQRVHEKGLVHRDIKGDNIFLETGDGDVVVKLIDFGIVKETSGRGSEVTGSFVGTPTAAAPEQLLGQEIGSYTDIYQVGVLAYELLSGHHPFENVTSVSFEAIARAQIFEMPASLGAVAPGLPAEVVDAVMTMLQKEPARRVRPGRDGLPDGSARAFRTPFRNLLRELEQRQAANSGLQTTQHRMLQMVQASDALAPPSTPAAPPDAAGAYAPAAPNRTIPLPAPASPGASTLSADEAWAARSPEGRPPTPAPAPVLQVTPAPAPALGGSGIGRHGSTTAPTASATSSPTSPQPRAAMVIGLVAIAASVALGGAWLVVRHHTTREAAAASPIPPIPTVPAPSLLASAAPPVTAPPAQLPPLAPAAPAAPEASAGASRAPSASGTSWPAPTSSGSGASSEPVASPGRSKPSAHAAPAASGRDPAIWGLGVFP